MSFREDLYDKLDVDGDGKVRFGDVVAAAEERFGAIQTRWGFFGFVAGVVVTSIAVLAL